MAPLYPLLSSAGAFLARIGGGIAFPSSGDFGPHCSTAINAMYLSFRTLVDQYLANYEDADFVAA
jgi:hypothetical protein